MVSDQGEEERVQSPEEDDLPSPIAAEAHKESIQEEKEVQEKLSKAIIVVEYDHRRPYFAQKITANNMIRYCKASFTYIDDLP